jgi:hypothetical protein
MNAILSEADAQPVGDVRDRVIAGASRRRHRRATGEDVLAGGLADVNLVEVALSAARRPAAASCWLTPGGGRSAASCWSTRGGPGGGRSRASRHATCSRPTSCSNSVVCGEPPHHSPSRTRRPRIAGTAGRAAATFTLGELSLHDAVVDDPLRPRSRAVSRPHIDLQPRTGRARASRPRLRRPGSH